MKSVAGCVSGERGKKEKRREGKKEGMERKRERDEWTGVCL